MDALSDAIRAIALDRPLSGATVTAAFDVVMAGGATPVQIAALLTGLRVRGESAEVVAGVARALRNAMIELPARDPSGLVDTCGTGGGTVPTFNISTAAALVAAGAGARVAKHGNRSFTSRCGSADVLEALRVGIDVPLDTMSHALRDAGIVFMYAPRMHPAMRHVGAVRRELGIPTVMNVVGPLANPAHAGRQVIGVADRARLGVIAEALAELGTTHAMVLHGEPGMDEISPLGITHVVEIRGARTVEWKLDSAAYGLACADPDDLLGGDAATNARVVLDVLAGRAKQGAMSAVLLNAAAAIYVAGISASFGDGVEIARATITSGAALGALDRLRSALPADI